MVGGQIARQESVAVRRRPRLAATARPALPFVVAAAIALGAVVAIAAPSFHSDVADPNDTKGPLDVRQVRLAHEGGTEVTVITFAQWSPSSIWDRGNAYVFLDTKGSEHPEYFVVARSTGSDLQASLWRDRRTRRDLFVRNVQIRRKTSDGVSVSVPVKSLRFGRQRESYFWWAVTGFTGERCRRTCIDRAPDAGSIEQWRPGMSPPPPTGTASPGAGGG
jgi:hypothetical protein